MIELPNRLPTWLRLPTAPTGQQIPWSDVALVLGATAVVQYWVVQRSDYWGWGPLWLVVLAAWSPLFLAIRRVDPTLALVGLLAGAYIVSLLSGGVAWPMVAGCLLALWFLPTRWGFGTGLFLTGVLAVLPVIVDLRRENLVIRIYPHVYSHIRLPDGTSETHGGIPLSVYERLSVHWAWWVSILVFVFGAAVMVVRRRQGVVPAQRSRGLWVEDLLRVGRPQDDVSPVDVLFAVALTSPVLVEIWWGKLNQEWWSAPRWMAFAVVFAPLTLVVRRRWPAIPAVVITMAALVAYWQTEEVWMLLIALAVALYSLGTGRPPLVWSLPVAVLLLGALPLIAWRIPYDGLAIVFPRITHEPFILGADGILRKNIYDGLVEHRWPFILSLILFIPVCVGVAVRLYGRNRVAARREAELEREAAERAAEQVVLAERSHIARDLHDVVAHAVNLMVIQAETGPDLVRRGDADVLAGFQRIGDAGRRALGELDGLLSALRDADGVPDPQLTPQPGLAEIRLLVTHVSSDQLPVELALSGDLDAPPAGHQLTAYRLVQEGLTNAVRHSKATGVKVTVNSGDDGIAVELSDDGIGFDAVSAGRTGRHGLAGMHERVRVHHGTLEIGTAPGTGTRITAWIPVGAAQ